MKAVMKLVLAISAFFFVQVSSAEKVLKWSENGAAKNIDTTKMSSVYAAAVAGSVYDTLFEYKLFKRPFEIKPNLAIGMPKVSKDKMTYTFEIQKGTRFMDDPCFKDGKGREVVAADFVYSLKRHFDPKNRSLNAWLWKGKIVGMEAWKKAGADYSKEVEGLKALGKYKIQIKTTKPFPQLIYTLAMPSAGIIPKEAIDKYGREISVKPVGSGPFILKSHNSKKTVLVRNPNYRKDVFDIYEHGFDKKKHAGYGFEQVHGKTMPLVNQVEASWMKETAARWVSFTKGNEITNTVLQNENMNEVLASKSPVKLRPKFQKKYHYRVAQEAGLVYNNFNMNGTFGYDKDPKKNAANKALRCAIRKSMNWPQRIKRFYLGIGEAYPGFIPPAAEGYDPTMSRDSVTLDVAGAKALLKEHGWNKKTLPVLEYPSVAGVRQKQFFEQFRGGLIKIGYPKRKIKFKTYATFGDFSKATALGKTDMIPMGWSMDYPDAENTLALFYGPNKAPGSNRANYQNPEFDKLFKEATQMSPGPKRTAKYKKLNRMLVEDCVTIAAYSRTRVRMWHKDVIMWPSDNMISSYLKFSGFKK